MPYPFLTYAPTSVIGFLAPPIHRFRFDRCYSTCTAIVTDIANRSTRRVVASVVRRHDDASKDPSPRCIPDDIDRSNGIELVVRTRLEETGEARHLEFVDVGDPDPKHAVGDLIKIAASSASHAKSGGGLAGLKVLHLFRETGRDADMVRRARFGATEGSPAHCDSPNAQLADRFALYRSAC